MEKQNENDPALSKRVAEIILKLGDQANEMGLRLQAYDYYQMAGVNGNKEAESKKNRLLQQGPLPPESSSMQRQNDYRTYAANYYYLAKDAENRLKDLPLAKELYTLAARFDHNQATFDERRIANLISNQAL